MKSGELARKHSKDAEVRKSAFSKHSNMSHSNVSSPHSPKRKESRALNQTFSEHSRNTPKILVEDEERGGEELNVSIFNIKSSQISFSPKVHTRNKLFSIYSHINCASDDINFSHSSSQSPKSGIIPSEVPQKSPQKKDISSISKHRKKNKKVKQVMQLLYPISQVYIIENSFFFRKCSNIGNI